MYSGFGPAGPLGRLFQTAYVTNDLARATAIMGERLGIAEFYIGDVHPLPQTDGTVADIRAALAWCGGNQIEIIEQSGGTSGLYRDFLPADQFAIRHHHFCGLIERQEDFTQAEQDFLERGIGIAVSIKREKLHAFYADTREIFGHYMEYVWLADENLLTLGGKVPVYGECFVPNLAAG